MTNLEGSRRSAKNRSNTSVGRSVGLDRQDRPTGRLSRARFTWSWIPVGDRGRADCKRTCGEVGADRHALVEGMGVLLRSAAAPRGGITPAEAPLIEAEFLFRQSGPVQKYGGDVRVRKLRCTEQFRAMAFAQLTFRESLRDVEVCLDKQPSKLYSTGFRNPVARSTLADANEQRDWLKWHDLPLF